MSCIRSCYDKDSSNFGHDDCPTCIHKDSPPQRIWVGLTDGEYKELHLQMGPVYYYQEYGQAIEAKLKEKNT